MPTTADGLNEAQRFAVSSSAEVLQILSGPGSGKTKTLTARVAYLISKQCLKPWNIIVCTFTVKAAKEMRQRIRSLIGDGLESRLFLGTFHSVARRYLVEHHHLAGLSKGFGIADSSDSLNIVRRIVKRRKLTINPNAARSRISSLKAQNITCDHHVAVVKKADQQEFAIVFKEYEETLRAQNILDYDDLLLRCADLLRKHPECVSNIEAVLIDEFQDTNICQFELMQLFAQRRNRITIVGDPDQSIYGWRSADTKNLERMRQRYPETNVVLLEENYRSSGSILLAAMDVIEQDESRPAKRLLATHLVGPPPVVRMLPDTAAEGNWIVQEIRRARALTGRLLNLNDFAILIRSAQLSRSIESALGKVGIPYRMVGGAKFSDRAEVKLVLDYLRVLSMPNHNDVIARILNVPSRRIGDVTVSNLIEEAESTHTSLWELIKAIAQGNISPRSTLSSSATKGLESFINVILTSTKKLAAIDKSRCSIGDLVEHLLKKLGLEEYLKKTYPEDFAVRWANIEELKAQANDFPALLGNNTNNGEEDLPISEDANAGVFSPTAYQLAEFLANFALSSDNQREKEEEPVDEITISTIHAAKGLEWPVVFIPAMYKGSIPHSRAEDTDEERRLLYVAMTRAQALLYLSCPNKDFQREETKLSPFLASKSFWSYVGRKGPSFTYTLAGEMARIIRRPSPSLSALAAAESEAESREDDYWTIEGHEIPIDNKRRDHSELDNAHAFKRCKVDTTQLEGFRSAGMVLTELNSTMTKRQPLGTSKRQSISDLTYSQQSPHGSFSMPVFSRKLSIQSITNASKSRAAEISKVEVKCRSNQGPITSFFKQPPASATEARDSRPPDLDAETDFSRDVSALQDVPDIRVAKRKPHPSCCGLKISQTSSKLVTASTCIHTKSEDEENDETIAQRHVRDSSSLLQSPTRLLKLAAGPDLKTTSNGSDVCRPTSNLNKATVAQISSRPFSLRRTLGARRGLNSDSNRPFTRPTMFSRPNS